MEIEQPEGAVFIKTTIGVLDGKWKLLILWHLRNEAKRFGELNRLIPEISEKVLTQQLRNLERDDIINRDVQAGSPPTVAYSFTDHGKTVIPILQPLCDWGKAHLNHLDRHLDEQSV